MKRRYFFISLFFSLILFDTKAQVPDWEWARGAQSGSIGFADGFSVVTDLSQNIYFSGIFLDSLSFGPFVSKDTSGIYLVKYDSAGNVKWLSTVGCSAGYITALAIDGESNLYLAGPFSNNISFDTIMLLAVDSNDIFIAKYDSSGNVIWAKNFGSTGNDICWNITTDSNGNPYITGYFSSPKLIFGKDTLINKGAQDFFVAKLDSSGNTLWAKSVGGIKDDAGYGVSADAFSNVYVTGYFKSPALTFGSTALVNPGYFENMFVVKYDSIGTVKWAKCASITARTGIVGFAITADNLGNVYATGAFGDPVTFGTYTLNNVDSIYSDGYIVKYDSTGQAIWAKDISGNSWGDVNPYCIASDKYGKIYLTGGSNNNPFAYANSCSVTIDSITLHYPIGSSDPSFIFGFDPSGKVLFSKQLQGTGDDQLPIAISSTGSIYIGGDYNDANPFIVGKDSLMFNYQNENAFLAKLSYKQSGEGITEIDNSEESVLYPNPFNDNLNVLTKETQPSEIILYDLTSRKLLQQKFTNSISLNTSQLAGGLYFYEVRNENGTVAKGKVVKE